MIHTNRKLERRERKLPSISKLNKNCREKKTSVNTELIYHKREFPTTGKKSSAYQPIQAAAAALIFSPFSSILKGHPKLSFTFHRDVQRGLFILYFWRMTSNGLDGKISNSLHSFTWDKLEPNLHLHFHLCWFYGIGASKSTYSN